MPEKLHVISVAIDYISFRQSLEDVMTWTLKKRSSYICFANVHMTIEAYKDKSFREKVYNANLVLADGKPIASSCKILYNKKQERISGMDFTPRILAKANEKRLAVFIYGSTNDVINAFKEKLNFDFPRIRFAGAI